jgi:transcriptional regulator with XRE-family HTH domain
MRRSLFKGVTNVDSNGLILWRKSRGMTQQQLADMLKVRRETVNNWEKGRYRIPQSALPALAEASPEPPDRKTANLPAERPYARWRPYPWANRDYTPSEVERCKAGRLVWRLILEGGTEWTVMQAFKTGHFHHGLNITMPAQAFPDPMGQEASWARDLFASKEAAERLDISRRNDLWRDMGIPPEKI